MAYTAEGKIFLSFLVIFLWFPSFSWWVHADSSSAVVEDQDKLQKSDFFDVLDEIKGQNFQLQKLEKRVEELAERISSLLSQFSDCSKVPSLISNSKIDVVQENVEFIREKGKGEADAFGTVGFQKEKTSGNLQSDLTGVETGEVVSVTKFSSPFWNERFHFVSAVKLGSNPTCIHVLPFRDVEGLSKYIVVGDNLGRLFVLSRNGDLLNELDFVVNSAVISAVSYLSIHKNETMIVSGHVNGAIVMNRVWEESNGDDWNSVLVERTVKFDTLDVETNISPVTILEMHHVGRKRYVLSVDLGGRITVFRENGTVYGTATPSSRPLAFSKQRLLFLTENGAGSLDLRTMKIREASCEGLNNSAVEYYEFDAIDRSKAFGITTEGDLIQILLLGDVMNFKCRVRSKRKVDMQRPLAVQAIKGYLLIADTKRVSVYNVSSHNYVRSGSPKLVFSTELSRIAASLLDQHQNADDIRSMVPVLGSDREKLVILSLGSGYVGMYRSNLPLFKNEFKTMQWTSPVLFFILFLFGAWHFLANKKDALTSWGLDDPFNSSAVVNGTQAGAASGDRSSLTDSSRNPEVDRKGSAAREPSRRYPSPARYPASSGISNRPPHADVKSVSTSVDPDYRAAGQDLKYRASNLDNTAFPKRRDGAFVNNVAVDDNT